MFVPNKAAKLEKNDAEGQIKFKMISITVWYVRVDMFLINLYK